MRRPRGCGGRFLNTKRSDDGKHGAGSEETSKPHIFLSTGSQNSEVLQSDSSNLTSRREANCGRSSMCGSEVTSVFSIGDLNLFSMNNHRASVLSLSDMMNAGRGTIMPSKWVAAGDSCCNLKAWHKEMMGLVGRLLAPNPILYADQVDGFRFIYEIVSHIWLHRQIILGLSALRSCLPSGGGPVGPLQY